MKLRTILFYILVFASVPSLASTKTVTLIVPSMTCTACPITVKAALNKVAGVDKVTIHYDKKEVVVSYQNSKASIASLTRATANSGYPSQVKSTQQSEEL
ncbi:MAG: mercury resistance system periplasmic binding protein MerP [Idiomarina sp.]|uniref:mercury resistance system periplasmic binding protein MerP n=1 Tax=Idiomarina sp. TaxID=1874361 RepID=UPI001D2C3F08|nr:mercury resistance system periplasmic binding protein MerP [Idiomarina sp.]NQZ17432.1 mercury resistance system periplasmic binding protein MerP [Idiomarina sp.]